MHPKESGLHYRFVSATALMLFSAVICAGGPAQASNAVDLDEIASGVAVSNSGLAVVGLASAKRRVVVSTNGNTTHINVECSVSDVEVDAAGIRGWSICNDSMYLNVMQLPTGEFSSMDTSVTNAFEIEYSDAAKLLVILGAGGQLGVISVRSDADYELRSISLGESAAGLALSTTGNQAFISTESGNLIIVDTRSGKFRRIPVRLKGYQQVFLGSLAIHPSGRFLFASGYALKSGSSAYTAVVLTLNPTNGKSISSTTIAVDSTTIDLAATTSSLYVGLGLSVAVPNGSTGLLQFSVKRSGQLAAARAVSASPLTVSELELSANQRHLAVTTTNRQLLRLTP
jgi:hypothetical protein